MVINQVNKLPRNYPETTQKYLNENQLKILKIIKQNPYISRNALATEMGITDDGVKYNLNILKKKGIITRIGSDRSGYWKINM